MSFRDRRKLGVNFFSVLRSARKVLTDPEFEPTSRQEITVAILEDILGESLPQAKAADPAIDWDAIASFIERLLPIILQLLAVFGF